MYIYFVDKSPPTSSKSNVNAKQRHKTQFLNAKTGVAAKTGVRNRAASVASSRVSSIDSDHHAPPPVQAPSPIKKTNKSNKNQSTRASVTSEVLGKFGQFWRYEHIFGNSSTEIRKIRLQAKSQSVIVAVRDRRSQRSSQSTIVAVHDPSFNIVEFVKQSNLIHTK